MDTPINKEMETLDDKLSQKKEKRKARRRELYQMNKEHFTTKQKKLYAEGGGKAYKAQYYQDNREKMLKYNRDKYQNRIKLEKELQTTIE